MNSNRRFLALALSALASAGCVSRTSPTPPTFQAGGLLALSTPPPNPYSLQNALEGVYDTSSLFGSSVVVHASQWGDLSTAVQASVSILAQDHDAFAILQAGCLAPLTLPAITTTKLVLEGYWRYLDVNDPDPSTTGLVRLFVEPQAMVDYVCGAPAWNSSMTPGDPRPAPSQASVVLAGSSGNGENEPGSPLTVNWLHARKSRNGPDGTPTFLVGVHHGGCQTTDNCGISENTPQTAILAAQLGGDYLEVDTRLTKDNVPVFFHLSLNPGVVQGAYCTGQVEDYTYEQLLADCRLRNGEVIPRVVDMIDYILARTTLPLYLDSKTPDVILPVAEILTGLDGELGLNPGEYPDNVNDPNNNGYVRCSPPPPSHPTPWPPPGKRCLFPGSSPVWQRGVIGLPDSSAVSTYQQELAAKQFSSNQHCLVEEATSDVTGVPCVAWMPRYTRGPMTSDVLQLQQGGYFVGFWTINDQATIDAFLTTAVPNGILTNYLGLLNQRFEAVGTAPPYTPYRATTP